jgi:hypothetical protein
MEFLEEYRRLIKYHTGNANVVANALSRKMQMARLRTKKVQAVQELLE